MIAEYGAVGLDGGDLPGSALVGGIVGAIVRFAHWIGLLEYYEKVATQ